MATLLDEINSKCSQALIDAGDFHEIAAAVNVGRVKAVTKQAGIGTILNVLGPEAGGQLLDGLEVLSQSNAAVKWAMKLVDRGELDFGAPATRAMIDQLVTDPAVATALKAVAEVPDPVSWEQCRAAIQGA